MKPGDVFVVTMQAPLFMADTVTPLGTIYARKFDTQKGAVGGVEAFPATAECRVLFNALEFAGDYSTVKIDDMLLAEFVVARRHSLEAAQSTDKIDDMPLTESVVAGQHSLEAAQFANAQKILALENQIKNSTRFFWIAGLAVINSVIFFVGGNLRFVGALGVTQIIDFLAAAVAKDLNSEIGVFVRIVSVGINIFIVSLFVLCGFGGRKQFRWVVVIGMVLYVLDGLLLLAFQDWLDVGFHAFILWGLWGELMALNALARLKKEPVVQGGVVIG